MNFIHSWKLFRQSNRYLRQHINFFKSTPVLQFSCPRFLSHNISGNSKKPGVELTDNIVQLTDYTEQHHSVLVKKINNVLQDTNLSILSQQQKNLLFQCCGRLLSNKPLDLRRRLCDEVLEKIKSLNQLTVEDYNCYIQICTENELEIDFKIFLPSIICGANEETYKLLLENVCERSNTEKAMEILKLMKQVNISEDERVFNALILANGLLTGLQGAENVITSMRAAKITESSRTYWNLLKALATHQNKQDFLMILNNPVLKFDEMQFMDLLLRLGLHDNHEWLSEVKRKFSIETIPRSLSHLFDHVCINLIHRGKAKTAIEMHCLLTDENVNCKLLLEEVVGSINSPEIALEIVDYLNMHKKRKSALKDMTEYSLKLGKTDISWKLLENFSTLRPHYFWPLLVRAAKENGELGAINALKRMISTGVTIDADTIEFYLLPYCDLTDLNSLMTRLKYLNLTMKQLSTPVIVVALRADRIKEAKRLCEDVTSIDGNRVVKSLGYAWKNTKDITSALWILKRICECNESATDLTGMVLLQMFRLSKNHEDYCNFLKVLKILKKEKLHIKPTSAEKILKVLQRQENCKIGTEIEDAVDGLLNLSLMNDSNSSMVHPNYMTAEELECHLVELQSKNLEIRGVLRRLVQQHARLGNDKKVFYYADSLKKLGYKMSPGILASLLTTYTRDDNLQLAVETFEKLRNDHPAFLIDHFKIINLAKLMLKNGRYEETMKMLKTLPNRSSSNVEAIQKNVKELLNEAKDSHQALEILECLLSKGCCNATNIILGSVIRSFLKCNDINGAIKYYTKCANDYKCTPLQVELLNIMIEQRCEEKLSQIIEATSAVHGVKNAQFALAAALAEQGLVKPLNKLLTEMKTFPDNDLKNRCDWWVQEKKLIPLETLSKAGDGLPKSAFNIDIVYMSILQIYVNGNDCEGALDFFNTLNNNDILPVISFANEVKKLLKRNKYTIPDNLLRCTN